MQSAQSTFKKGLWNELPWAIFLANIPRKTWWVLSFSQDFVILEKFGVALDLDRPSGAGVLLSDWHPTPCTHTVLRTSGVRAPQSPHIHPTC